MVIRQNGGFDVAISFCKYLFNDSYPVFLILKKDPQREGEGSTGKHTVGTQSSTQMFCVSCVLRDIYHCTKL